MKKRRFNEFAKTLFLQAKISLWNFAKSFVFPPFLHTPCYHISNKNPFSSTFSFHPSFLLAIPSGSSTCFIVRIFVDWYNPHFEFFSKIFCRYEESDGKPNVYRRSNEFFQFLCRWICVIYVLKNTLSVIGNSCIGITFRKIRPQEIPDHNADYWLRFFFVAPMIEFMNSRFDFC